MFKKTLIAAAIVGITAMGAATTASAHDYGYKHSHKGQYSNYNKHKKYSKHKKYGKYNKHKHGYGNKRGGFPPHVIRNTLQLRGYHKIHFQDRRLPVYVVRACKRGHNYRIGLNRWGKVLWKKSRGHCGRRFF